VGFREHGNEASGSIKNADLFPAERQSAYQWGHAPWSPFLFYFKSRRPLLKLLLLSVLESGVISDSAA
jgi:hypothetical protein